MERITDISQLKTGDKIVRVWHSQIQIIEFLCVHPHHKKYSLFLDENGNGMPKFYNPRLNEEEWYLFDNSYKNWEEVYCMKIEQTERELKFYREYIEAQRNKYLSTLN